MNESTIVSPPISQRAIIGVGWVIAWRVATRNIGLLSTLILVRLLQPTDFGLVALATGFISSVDALSSVGVQDALVRAPMLDRDMYDTGFGLGILRGVLTALIIAAIAWPVANFFKDIRLAVVMLALSGGTLLSAFENIGIIDFRRDLAFRREFKLQFRSRVISAATTISVAAVWHTYWALVAGILVYRLVRLLQSFLMSPYRPHFAVRAWRRIIGFSLWTWGQTMVYQVRERSDVVIIGRLLGTVPVGLFSVGLELGSLPITEIIEPMGRALFSAFTSLHNASAGLRNMFLGSVGLGLMLILPAGVGISMIADPMVRSSLGDHWLAAVPVVQILAIGGLTAIFIQPCGNFLNAVGLPHVMLYIGVVSTLVKVVAMLLLVPAFGLSGAAAAMVLLNGVDLVFLLRSTLPRIDVSFWELAKCAVRPAIATAGMVVVLWQLEMAWTPSTGSDGLDFACDAAIRSAVGAACYGIVLFGTWFVMGRPDGAEQFTLTILGNMWARVRR
jgi:lipopolysaccharide exporter